MTTREYKAWTKEEEKMLVSCMRELVEGRHVEKGNFKTNSFTALEKMMHTRMPTCKPLAVSHVKSKVRYFKDKFVALLELKKASSFGWDDVRGCVVADEAIFSGWVKSHPRASGLNNKPVPYWDDLCFIFGAELATGADAVQPEDAASKVNTGAGNSDYMDDETEQGESYTIPRNLDHNAVMCDLINKGVDIHATSLKEVEAEISSKRTAVVGQKGGTSSGTKRSRQVFMDEERARIAQSMEAANENIARIATNYCIEGDLAVKRQNLYQELCNFPDLTPFMRTRILRHLNRDDGDATTYFQLPTSEEKLAFVWTLLE
ncbi:hypothetical protein LINPERHAP2_LOCUS3197 [Linum perenne]